MSRIDQSDFIIHFTKGKKINTSEEAYENFKKILIEGELKGGSNMIRGEYKCVCFTESPIGCLIQDRKKSKNYLDTKYFERYSPFGFHFSKVYIHKKGGRHVIYSRDSEFESLPITFKWRFMRYEPDREKNSNIDFTWEREWRVKGNLKLDKKNVNLVFPNREWINRFIKDYESLLLPDCAGEKTTTILKLGTLFDPIIEETIKHKCVDTADFPYTLIDLGLENYV